MRDLRDMQRFPVTSDSLKKVYWWMEQAVIQLEQVVIQNKTKSLKSREEGELKLKR